MNGRGCKCAKGTTSGVQTHYLLSVLNISMLWLVGLPLVIQYRGLSMQLLPRSGLQRVVAGIDGSAFLLVD